MEKTSKTWTGLHQALAFRPSSPSDGGVELGHFRRPQRGHSNKAQGNALGVTGENRSPSPERAKHPVINGDLKYFALSGLDDTEAIIPRPLAWALLLRPRWGKLHRASPTGRGLPKCPNSIPPFLRKGEGVIQILKQPWLLSHRSLRDLQSVAHWRSITVP